MRLTFSAKYKVGDKVQVLEHNFNCQVKVGKVVDIGIDFDYKAFNTGGSPERNDCGVLHKRW